MKTCTKCGEEKSLAAFAKKLNGLQPKCRSCCAVDQAEWWKANADDQRRKAAARYANDRAAALEKQKAYYAKNRDARLAYGAEWRAKNPDKIRAEYAAKADAYRARSKGWKKQNPEHCRMLEKARRAASRRVPAWGDRALMADIYHYAKIMRAAGVNCHVDHIVPLRGKNVCGLHVHDNLTVILAEDNLRKGARHHG